MPDVYVKASGEFVDAVGTVTEWNRDVRGMVLNSKRGGEMLFKSRDMGTRSSSGTLECWFSRFMAVFGGRLRTRKSRGDISVLPFEAVDEIYRRCLRFLVRI